MSHDINQMLRFCTHFVLIFLAALLIASPSQAGPSGSVRVIDGDTIDVGGVRVRLHGIDAPEIGQTCTNANGAVWECGRWVAQEARARWQGAHARCDMRDIDRYGRVVAVCRIGGEDIGRALVRDGLAVAYRRFSMAYDLDEKAAVIAGRGLHGHDMQRPGEFRSNSAAGSGAADPACNIKGNISRDGTRIYHVPGQYFYDRTRINTGKGERWFCSEAEARAAGWRRARR